MDYDPITDIQRLQLVMDGLSKLYITAQKIFQTNHLAVGLVNSGKVWVEAEKISSNGSFLTNSGGIIDISAQQFEDDGIIGPGFEITGGTTILHGGRMISTNTCIQHRDGVARVENLSFDSSASKSSPIVVAGDGLVLKNCSVTSANGVASISATSSKTVVIDGTLTINTAPDTNVIFTTGTLVVTDGTGTPEGAIFAPWGSRYSQKGSMNRWIKDSFSGNAGWVKK
jgi:hypothetical protein